MSNEIAMKDSSLSQSVIDPRIMSQLAETMSFFQEQLTAVIKDSLVPVMAKITANLKTSLETFTNALNEMAPLLSYIEEHEDLIDDDMSFSEALEKIDHFYAMQNNLCYSAKQVNLLSSALSLYSSVKAPELQISIGWLILTLVMLFDKEDAESSSN